MNYRGLVPGPPFQTDRMCCLTGCSCGRVDPSNPMGAYSFYHKPEHARGEERDGQCSTDKHDKLGPKHQIVPKQGATKVARHLTLRRPSQGSIEDGTTTRQRDDISSTSCTRSGGAENHQAAVNYDLKRIQHCITNNPETTSNDMKQHTQLRLGPGGRSAQYKGCGLAKPMDFPGCIQAAPFLPVRILIYFASLEDHATTDALPTGFLRS